MSDQFVIGVSEKDASDYWEMVNQGFRRSADKLGATVHFSSPKGEDAQYQREQIERNFLDETNPVDALAVVGSDPAVLQTPINDALERGIPVLCFDLDLPDSGRCAFIASADPDELGRMAGQEMIERIDGEGNVAIQTGSMNAPGAMGKIKGFREVIGPSDININVVENDHQDNERALRQSRSILDQYRIDGMYGVYARNGPIQAKAVTERDLVDDVTIVGFDMLPATVDYLQRGVIDVSIWIKEFYFGYYTAAIAYNVGIHGLETALEMHQFNPNFLTQNTLNVPPQTYTPETVSNFTTWESMSGVHATLDSSTPLPPGESL